MYVNLPKFQRKHYDDSNQGNMVREKDKQMATSNNIHANTKKTINQTLKGQQHDKKNILLGK